MEDTNSCPAFIERPEGPFSTTFELQHSPNLSRLSMRFGSSALLGEDENDENDENISPLRLDTPPTPPYRKYSRRSPKRTPPSPTVLKGYLSLSVFDTMLYISNHTPSGVPHFIKRRCLYSPRRSNSVSSIPVRRLHDIYEEEGITINEEPLDSSIVSSNSRKRPYLTNSTSSLPDCFALPPLPEDHEPTFEEPSLSALSASYSMLPPLTPVLEEKHEEERVHCVLPTIPGSSTDYNRINGQTLQALLSGEYDERIEKYVIMDCRYEYEYVGGHIRTAIHMSPEQIFDYFREMPEPVRASTGGKRRLVIIMHCEYSTVRAPACIRLLRHYDRSVNLHRGYSWPLCSFPDVYLLDGGYRKFFDHHKTSCDPQNYVPENAKQHQQLRVIHKRSRKEQLRRSQSFSA